MSLLERFLKAGQDGREFRPVPFWSWNDKLEPDEVRWQLKLMKKAGFGGAFLHARRGLETNYLGKDWMDCLLAACDEGRESGLLPWLYDEDCWPSGTCGSRVTQGRPEMQSKTLYQEFVRPMQFRPLPQTVGVFIGTKDESGLGNSFRRLSDLQSARSMHLKPGEVMLHFYYETHEYVDVLNRAATSIFIESTHEEYRRVAGRFFGGIIPGIFTDEPLMRNLPPGIVWSLELPEFFRRSAGYDLVDKLPGLFFPLPGAEKVRFDYHQALLRLFLLAFTLPVYQWCDRHKLSLTGHFMAEDSLNSQIQYAGAVMPHYEYMHIPGIDHLCRKIASPVLPKQVSSAANQFGRRRVLSEMWGAAGQNVNFEELRWIADWQFVFGINMVCPHLSLYSMRGCRKRDFPPNLFFQQPYWKHMRQLSDTLTRTTSLLAQGDLVANVLLLHPITSAWALASPKAREEVLQLDKDLDRLTSALVGLHADFEFGDEMIMERHGHVQKAAVSVGKRHYTTVVVPSCVNWKSSTLNLLRRFTKSGGRLIFTGRLPHLLDGLPSKELQQFAAKQKFVKIATATGLAKLKKLINPALQVTVGRGKTDAREVAVMWRNCGHEQLFFLVNLSPDKDQELTALLPAKGEAQQLDAATGQPHPLPARAVKGGLQVKLHLPPMGSTMVLVDTHKKPLKALEAHPRPRRTKVLARHWQYRRLDSNALVLDKARPTIGETVHDKILPLADINKMLLLAGEDTVVELAFEFHTQLDGAKSLHLQLAVEMAKEFEIHLNGLRVPLREEGWWVDKSIHLLDISRLVARGRNQLTLRRPYFVRPDHRDRMLDKVPRTINNWVFPQVEFEPIYLVGDFAVTFDGAEETGPAGLRNNTNEFIRTPVGRSIWLGGSPIMTAAVNTGSGHDLLRGGLPFFAGTVELSQTLIISGNPSQHALIEMSRPDAIVTQLVVNGHELPVLWQQPYRQEVGQYLQKGKNEIAIRLTSSLRNLFGPHHNAGGDYFNVGPASFEGTKCLQRGHLIDNADYRKDYNFVPFGLTDEVVLYY